MNKHLLKVYENLKEKYAHETLYLDSVYEFLESVDELDLPDLETLGVIERLVEPEKIITFQVPWVDDKGIVRVNLGYRVQSSSLLGPYKGGLRFDKSVDLSTLKFLGFEQTLKNSLTTLLLGGAKGGSDFHTYDKSDGEIMRFTQNFMREFYRYIGKDTDVPAGDIGVGKRELGYLYGAYKKITNLHDGTFTGKNVIYGGSRLRPEATGYGVIYILEEALKAFSNEDIRGKTLLISGSGQVGINACFKARELGANVVGVSSITGVLYDAKGIDIDLVSRLQIEKRSFKYYLSKYPNAKFYEDTKKLWQQKADIAIPCATQNEIDLTDAKTLVNNGIKIIVEGANKPSTLEATRFFLNEKVLLIPSKAANAGGVSVSTLEMSQNASHLQWDEDKVDLELKKIMKNIFNNIHQTAINHGDERNLVKGANIAAFMRLYQAIKESGV